LQLRQAIELNPQIRVVRPEPPQGELEIVEVTTRKQINQFVKLPWTVYENDPWWSPPLLTTEKDYINPRKNPFYLHGSAAKFLALRDGKPVGRILAADDPEYNNYQNANVGTFGMFECLDDRQAAHRLLDTANEWIRDRGRYTVTGPIDYSLNYSAGLLVDGFHTRASFLMNHGKVYYQDFLESWGLKKAKDLYSWWFDAKNNQLADWAPRIKKIKKHFSINVRPFQINDIENEVRIFRNIINETHKHNWGFVPLSEAETNYYFKMLAKFAMPELVLVAEIAGEPIGVSLCIPDFNELFAPLNGRLTRCGLPTKLWHLFKNRRKFTQARIALLGVLEKYRSRGVVELLSAETMRVGIAAGLIGAEFGWTLENNEHVNRVIEKSGGTHFRTHRIYEKRVKE